MILLFSIFFCLFLGAFIEIDNEIFDNKTSYDIPSD